MLGNISVRIFTQSKLILLKGFELGGILLDIYDVINCPSQHRCFTFPFATAGDLKKRCVVVLVSRDGGVHISFSQKAMDLLRWLHLSPGAGASLLERPLTGHRTPLTSSTWRLTVQVANMDSVKHMLQAAELALSNMTPSYGCDRCMSSLSGFKAHDSLCHFCLADEAK